MWESIKDWLGINKYQLYFIMKTMDGQEIRHTSNVPPVSLHMAKYLINKNNFVDRGSYEVTYFYEKVKTK